LLLLVFSVCTLGQINAAWAEIEVITLKNRSAEQLMPLLTPLVERGGALTGSGSQLIIRASSRNIAELRKVLDSVDRAPRRLLISVRQATETAGSGSGARISGTVYGSSGTVGGAAQAQVYSSGGARADGITQTIQAVEDAPAQIEVGESVAIPQTTVVGIGTASGATSSVGGMVVNNPPVYRDAGTGFQVVAHLSGERVTLDISPRRDRITDRDTGAIVTQHASTTLSAPLGEWVDVGTVSTREAQPGGISSAQGRVRRVQVKVEELR
jgi:type II secretory pathway component GspD/PulD (secretin)